MDIVNGDKLPESLIKAINNVYMPARCKLSNHIEKELESREYDAYRLKINDKHILFRNAKITPTKVGQFVTLWKRSEETKKITPIDFNDNVDIVIIAIIAPEGEGQFIFNKHLLYKKNIFSGHNKEGKRAIRVYPPWCEVKSTQAIRTKKWQEKYFLSYPQDNVNDLCMKFQSLLTRNN